MSKVSSRRISGLAALLAAAFAAVVLAAGTVSAQVSTPTADAAFGKAWTLLEERRYAEAREELAGIDPPAFDLGDYVLYFSGLALEGEGKREEAARRAEDLEKAFPASPLVPCLWHELAFGAARGGDLARARACFLRSRGKVSGGTRKAQESYIEALLREEEGDSPGAARMHLDNFSAHLATDAGILSMERLLEWRSGGKLNGMGLPLGFYSTFGAALAKSGEMKKSRSVYAEAVGRFPRTDAWYRLLLDFAESLRRQGSTSEALSLLEKSGSGAPPALRPEIDLLRARVVWKAGRLEEARKMFLEMAPECSRADIAEKALYNAATLAEKMGDAATAAREFGGLRKAADREIRWESAFRHAFGLYLQGRFAEAAAAFEETEKENPPAAEKARFSFWKARSLLAGKEAGKAGAAFALLASDCAAGPYALLSLKQRGEDPFAMLAAATNGETALHFPDREALWEKVGKASWSTADAASVGRARRLAALGVGEYATFEADRVDATALKDALGLVNGGAGSLFRYLAGDLRGAIRQALGLPNDPGAAELVDFLQYPLAPEYVGDCDRSEHGVDPLLLHSVIRQESVFQRDALSVSGAVGLMQLMPATAAELARNLGVKEYRRGDLLRPRLNVRMGAAYLSWLIRECKGEYFRAVASYNAGPRAVAEWWKDAGEDPALFLEKIGSAETRLYVRKVFANLLNYYRIYRPTMFARYFPAPKGAPSKI